MYIIGICGRSQHGKDTLANKLRDVITHAEIKHFADYLKTIIIDVFGISYYDVYVGKNNVLPHPIYVDDYLNDLSAYTGLTFTKLKLSCRTPRELMQIVGTNYIRAVNSSYFINKLLVSESIITRFIIIADVRFPNEANAIINAGGLIIKVIRLSKEIDDGEHESEKSVDDIVADYCIYR